MYVDVIACRRGRIKVDVTLAKRGVARPEPTVINIPVKKAAPPAEGELSEIIDIADIAEMLDEPEASDAVEIINIDTADASEPEMPEEAAQDDAPAEAAADDQEMETVMELLAMAGEGSADGAADEVGTIEFFETGSTPDEDLTAIDELLAGADEEISEEAFDDIVADALDELDDMNRRADVMRERLDGQLAKALEEINGSADEDSEELTSIIDKELESLDSVLIQREGAADEAPVQESEIPRSAETSAYMRYFDRDAQGGRVEASRDNATGQEVICIDEASGRLSRVCGIIKKDGDMSEYN